MINNILMVQDSSPCIRTIKIASALQSKGFKIDIAYNGNPPDEVYGFGNSSFENLIELPGKTYKQIEIITKLVTTNSYSIIHYHNQPDKLGAKLIEAKLGIPLIYDQHDCMSFKHHLSRKEKKYEKICNEQADGTIYITEPYRNEVGKLYVLKENSLCFANYFPADSTLDVNDFLPKLSKQDKNKHLVYLGRISEHRNDHRNIVEILRKLSGIGFIIHIYPSKNKKYKRFEDIKNVIIHQKLPYKKLLREISQYDFGVTVFNDEIAKKLPHIKYAFGNKTFDYICAGIPVLAQECLDEVKNFVLDNGFGFILENYDDYINISGKQYYEIEERILTKRISFSMENQIQRMIDFYNNLKEIRK